MRLVGHRVGPRLRARQAPSPGGFDDLPAVLWRRSVPSGARNGQPELPLEPESKLPLEPESELPLEPESELPLEPESELLLEPESKLPPELASDLPAWPESEALPSSDTWPP